MGYCGKVNGERESGLCGQSKGDENAREMTSRPCVLGRVNSAKNTMYTTKDMEKGLKERTEGRYANN